MLLTAKNFQKTWKQSLREMVDTAKGLFSDFTFGSETVSYVLKKFTTEYEMFEEIGKKVMRAALVLQQSETERTDGGGEQDAELHALTEAAVEANKIILPLSTITYEIKKFAAKLVL